MEKFQEYQETAQKKLKLADHMLVITYPLVKDPKLLLAITNNILSSIDCSIASLIHFERLFKRIPPFPDTPDGRLDIFKTKLIPKFNISRDYITLISSLREIVQEHQSSSVEFARKDKFVICSSNYRLRTLSMEDLKKYIARTKVLVNEMERLVKRDDNFPG